MPSSTTKWSMIAILSTAIIALLLFYISIQIFGRYGYFVFIFAPFIIGFLPPFIYGKNLKITRNKSFLLSFYANILSVLGLLVFAMEGLICILMASPIILILSWLGSYVGYLSTLSKWKNAPFSMLALSIFCLGFDSAARSEIPVSVNTKIKVAANIE